MNTRRLILFGGLAFAAFIVFMQVKNLGQQAPVVVEKVVEAPVEKVEYVDVLIAARDINIGTRVRESQLAWKKWPAEAVSGSLITRENAPNAMEDFAGRVVRAVIYDGEPISERKIVDTKGKGVLAGLLRPGMTAVAIQISVDSAAGGFIAPGDRVDIILTHEKPKSRVAGLNSSGTDIVSETIFKNVHVLAIDDTFANGEESENAFLEGSTATLELAPRDVEILKEAEAEGDITLILRGLSDARGRSARVRREAQEEHIISVYRQGHAQYVPLARN